MKNLLNKTGNAIKFASVTVATKTLGVTHFLGQTVADISMETEASMKLRAYGLVKMDTKRYRVQRTIEHQQAIMDKYFNTVNAIRSLRLRAPQIEESETIDLHTLETSHL